MTMPTALPILLLVLLGVVSKAFSLGSDEEWARIVKKNYSAQTWEEFMAELEMALKGIGGRRLQEISVNNPELAAFVERVRSAVRQVGSRRIEGLLPQINAGANPIAPLIARGLFGIGDVGDISNVADVGDIDEVLSGMAANLNVDPSDVSKMFQTAADALTRRNTYALDYHKLANLFDAMWKKTTTTTTAGTNGRRLSGIMSQLPEMSVSDLTQLVDALKELLHKKKTTTTTTTATTAGERRLFGYDQQIIDMINELLHKETKAMTIAPATAAGGRGLFGQYDHQQIIDMINELLHKETSAMTIGPATPITNAAGGRGLFSQYDHQQIIDLINSLLHKETSRATITPATVPTTPMTISPDTVTTPMTMSPATTAGRRRMFDDDKYQQFIDAFYNLLSKKKSTTTTTTTTTG